MLELRGNLQGEYFPLAASHSYPCKPGGMGQEDAALLSASGALFQEPKARALLAAGVGRDWPDARGVFYSRDAGFAAWVNQEEHLMLIARRSDGDLRAAFGCLCAAERTLGTALEQEGYGFLRDPKLGFLMALPERLGTGLSIGVTLRLPKLAVGTDLQDICASMGLKIVKVVRGLVEVENRATLGVSEAGLVTAMIDGCAKLLKLEG